MAHSKELQAAIDARKTMKQELKELKVDSFRLRSKVRYFAPELVKEEREAMKLIRKNIKRKIRAMESLQNLITQEFKRLGTTDANVPRLQG